MRTESVRFVRAAGIVAAVFAIPALCAAFAGGGQAPEGAVSDAAIEASAGGIGFSVSRYMLERDPFAMLDQIEESLAEGLLQPSGSFAEEAGFPPGAQEQRANADGAVVSCVLSVDEGAALDAVVETLGAKGWTGVPLQGVAGATFVKQSGRLRWMLVTCTQVGEATSVVYRLDAVSER